MNKNKKEALTQFHQANILKAAETLFLEKGFEGTTMEQIAKSANYSKATLYVYFKNKEAIILMLTYNSLQTLYNHFHQSHLASPNFFKRYKELCYSLTDYAKTYPLYFKLGLSSINIHYNEPNANPILKQIVDIGECINNEISHFLQLGIEEKIIKPDLPILPTIFYFWSSLTGIISVVQSKKDYIEEVMGLSEEAYLDYSFKTLLQSILKEGIVNEY